MSSTQGGDEDVKVVLEQTLLRVNEVFVYRIPPMKTSGGHRAEDWNLSSALATCSLSVIRRDSSLYLNLMTEKPKPGGPKGATEPHLFAQCHIHIQFSDKPTKMEHWVEAVVDSSRYFVIRISDETTGREAHIGMGFRERSDATNFKLGLQDYENALRRERKAEAIHVAYETTHPLEEGESGSGDSAAADRGSSGPKSPVSAVSKLSLQDGEKIHIHLKGTPDKPRRAQQEKRDGHAVGKGGLLLRKPPPPASPAPASDRQVEISPACIKTLVAGEENGGAVVPPVLDASSTAAVAESDVDDDEWGDFESST